MLNLRTTNPVSIHGRQMGLGQNPVQTRPRTSDHKRSSVRLLNHSNRLGQVALHRQQRQRQKNSNQHINIFNLDAQLPNSNTVVHSQRRESLSAQVDQRNFVRGLRGDLVRLAIQVYLQYSCCAVSIRVPGDHHRVDELQNMQLFAFPRGFVVLAQVQARLSARPRKRLAENCPRKFDNERQDRDSG